MLVWPLLVSAATSVSIVVTSCLLMLVALSPVEVLSGLIALGVRIWPPVIIETIRSLLIASSLLRIIRLSLAMGRLEASKFSVRALEANFVIEALNFSGGILALFSLTVLQMTILDRNSIGTLAEGGWGVCRFTIHSQACERCIE